MSAVAAPRLEDAVEIVDPVDSDEARAAAEQIAIALAPDKQIDNDLDVDTLLPDADAGLVTAETAVTDLPNTINARDDTSTELDPDFTGQSLLTDPVEAAGPSSGFEDPVQAGDDVYVPPSDPVVRANETGELQVLGGFGPDSMDEVEVEPSAIDNRLGDEAIADAIRRELREDAATTNLEINVIVRGGTVHLRGTVPGLEDAENAEDVASRVPGVREVIEELEVAEL